MVKHQGLVIGAHPQLFTSENSRGASSRFERGLPLHDVLSS